MFQPLLKGLNSHAQSTLGAALGLGAASSGGSTGSASVFYGLQMQIVQRICLKYCWISFFSDVSFQKQFVLLRQK